MKIFEAINGLDSLKQNTYTTDDKIRWLSTLDWTVKKLMNQYVGADKVIFNGYTNETDQNTELLVPAPYDEVYLRWLEAQIDYHNGEFDKFNASIIMYNTAYEAYANFYKRNHMPRHRGTRFIF